MDNKIVRKFKWFWIWQDEKEEAWLGQMARQGLHLQQPRYCGRYAFVQGAPREVAYRLDFVTNAKKSPDYFQLFKDAGWEHVGEMGGWQYWRKEVRDGEMPEIFTDVESKIQKYRRLLAFFAIFFPIFVINMVNYHNPHTRYQSAAFNLLYEAIYFVLFVVFMFMAFSTLMVVRRISQLKRK